MFVNVSVKSLKGSNVTSDDHDVKLPTSRARRGGGGGGGL